MSKGNQNQGNRATLQDQITAIRGDTQLILMLLPGMVKAIGAIQEDIKPIPGLVKAVSTLQEDTKLMAKTLAEAARAIRDNTKLITELTKAISEYSVDIDNHERRLKRLEKSPA